MNVYSLDIQIIATAYIVAESEEQALEIANRDLTETGIEFSDRHQSIGDNICLDGTVFANLVDNDEEIALSPAMSLNTRAGAYTLDQIDLAEELEDVD